MNEKILNNFCKKFKKVAVTGGAGFIGSHIIEELIDKDLEVVCIDDLSSGKKENIKRFLSRGNFRFYEIDVTDYNAMKKALSGVDIVFHNAASKKNICLKDPRRDLRVNGEGAFNVFELARDLNIKKVVHASTGSVYGEPFLFPQTEDHPLVPVSYYGVSKLAGERYGVAFNKLYGVDVTVLRYFHVYGPRQEFHDSYGGVVSIFLNRIINGKNLVIHGDGTQERTFTNVKDVVAANLTVAVEEKSKGEVYNCASGIKVSIKELAEFIIKHFNKKGIIDIEYDDWLVGDIKKFEVSNSKICKLGMTFERDFWQGILPTVNWIKGYYK